VIHVPEQRSKRDTRTRASTRRFVTSPEERSTPAPVAVAVDERRAITFYRLEVESVARLADECNLNAGAAMLVSSLVSGISRPACGPALP
jgi:hypothetical protein